MKMALETPHHSLQAVEEFQKISDPPEVLGPAKAVEEQIGPPVEADMGINLEEDDDHLEVNNPWNSPPRARTPPRTMGYRLQKIDPTQAMYAPPFTPMDVFTEEEAAVAASFPLRPPKTRRLASIHRKVGVPT